MLEEHAQEVLQQNMTWEEADAHYRNGACADLACAISEMTGLPMALLVDEDAGHAFVLDGDYAIDIRGRRPLSELREEWASEWPSFTGWEVKLVADELRRAECDQWSSYFKVNLPLAKQWAARLIDCGMNPPHMIGATGAAPGDTVSA